MRLGTAPQPSWADSLMHICVLISCSLSVLILEVAVIIRWHMYSIKHRKCSTNGGCDADTNIFKMVLKMVNTIQRLQCAKSCSKHLTQETPSNPVGINRYQ